MDIPAPRLREWMKNSRVTPAAGLALVVLAAGTGGAAAGSLITGADIKDQTITSQDLANGAVTNRTVAPGTLEATALSTAAVQALRNQPGAPGSRWLSGNANPSTSIGSNGDWYFNTNTQSTYTRVNGIWTFVVKIFGLKGDKGDTGGKGDAGTQWLSGESVPTSDLGRDGDWYLDVLTSNAYAKTNGAWTLRVNLQGIKGDAGKNGTDGTKGEAGLNGSTWLVGTGAPSDEQGKDNDLYLNSTNSDVYRKSSGAWSLLTNIKGDKGEPGTPGSAGAAGTPGTAGTAWYTGTAKPGAEVGSDGDFYLNTSTGDLYRKASGSWTVPIADLISTSGGSTTGGGTIWLTGSSTPASTLGDDGNLYLNTSNGAIYQKSTGTWGAIYTPMTSVTPKGIVFNQSWSWDAPGVTNAAATEYSTVYSDRFYLAGPANASGGFFGTPKALFTWIRTAGEPDIRQLSFTLGFGQNSFGSDQQLDGQTAPAGGTGATIRCRVFVGGVPATPYIFGQIPGFSVSTTSVPARRATFAATVPLSGVPVGKDLILRCSSIAASSASPSAHQVTDVLVTGTPIDATDLSSGG